MKTTFKAPSALGNALIKARSKERKQILLKAYLLIYGNLPGEKKDVRPRKNKSRANRR